MPKILLVSRDLKLRKQILNILLGQNILYQEMVHRFEVETFSSLKDAEEQITHQWFDTIILFESLFESDAADFTCPAGSQVLSHLRSSGKETPVITIMKPQAKDSLKESLPNLLRLGVYDVFSLPLDIEGFRDTAYRAVRAGMQAYETEKKVLYELAKLGPLSLGRLNQLRLILRALIVAGELQVAEAPSSKGSKREAA